MGPDPRGGVILGLLFYFCRYLPLLGSFFFFFWVGDGGGFDEYICPSVDISILLRDSVAILFSTHITLC